LRGYEEIPYRSILVAHEHHMKTDLTGYPKIVGAVLDTARRRLGES
jgi:hypothetical protein